MIDQPLKRAYLTNLLSGADWILLGDQFRLHTVFSCCTLWMVGYDKERGILEWNAPICAYERESIFSREKNSCQNTRAENRFFFSKRMSLYFLSWHQRKKKNNHALNSHNNIIALYSPTLRHAQNGRNIVANIPLWKITSKPTHGMRAPIFKWASCVYTECWSNITAFVGG